MTQCVRGAGWETGCYDARPMAQPEVAVAPLVRTAAGRFAEELRKRYGQAVLDVRLFGSFARGEADEDSDVDVAVVLERVDWTTQRDVIDLATDIGLFPTFPPVTPRPPRPGGRRAARRPSGEHGRSS